MTPPWPNPDLAPVLGHLAHTLGDLWPIYSRLAGLAIAPTLEPDEVAMASQQAAEELAPLRDRLAHLAALLPLPSAEEEEVELRPLELTRAGVECVLAELDPAIVAMTAPSQGVSTSSIEEVRARLQCVIADRLLPAIAGLTAALRVP
jgi:hypothetical protein